MIQYTKNLIDALLYDRSKTASLNDFLEEVQRILNENESEREHIKSALHTQSPTIVNAFEFDLLETDKIFHINQIQKVCIDYRLRFLESHLFKNNIPEEAISIMNALEKSHNTKLSGFKIMAPSKTFHLKNYDDPLLFAPMGNDYYYLIHQWGSDLNWYRKWLVLPFKNSISFVVFCVVISAIGTMVTPETKLSQSVGGFAPIIIFMFLFKSIVVTVAYYFFMMGKNFNSEIWNREFKEN